MAAIVVTAQNTRLDDAEATTDFGIIGGGPGVAVETDFHYQSASCVARKGQTASRGHFLSDNVDTDISTATGTFQTVMFKVVCTTPGLLELLSVPGWQLRIGSGSIPATSSSNYHAYDVHGNDTYPIDKSWLVIPIDPNIASHRSSTTGTPDLTLADFYALIYDQTGTSKDLNQGIDAVDVGAGLTLVGGDGADTDGVWQDFSDHDFGTASNRFGYVRENEGIFIIYGRMIIGTATATVFQDTGSQIVFPDGLFAAGFSGITIDLQGATTDVDFIRNVFSSSGTAAGEDTRPTFIVTGTSGAFDADTCSFTNFASLTLTSAATLKNCTISDSGLVDAGSGANLAGSSILVSTVAANLSALEWDVNLNPDGELNDMTFTMGATLTHAIEFGLLSPLAMTLRNVTFNGYNASNNVNDSTLHVKRTTGTVTVTIAGGTTPSFRTDGATVVIDTDVEITLTGLQTGSEVRVFDQGTGVELAGVESSGTSFAFTDAASNVVDIRIFHINFLPADIEGFTIPASPASIPIQQVFDRNFSNP